MNFVPSSALILDADLMVEVNGGCVRLSASDTDAVIRVAADDKAIDAMRIFSRRSLLRAGDLLCRATGKIVALEVRGAPTMSLLPNSNLLGRLLGLSGGLRLNHSATTWRILLGR